MRFANLLIASLVLLSMASASGPHGEGFKAANAAAARQFRLPFQEPSGFRISGYVRTADGQGVPDAAIYMAVASHLPGPLVAISGQDGFYQTDFAEFPSVETITVYAQRACYTFLPASETWMHYGGSYEKTIDFTAYPADCFRNFLPFLDSKDPGLIISGYVRTETGQGIPGVMIYRNFASYPGEIVAVTGPDGFYQAPFVYIPGDEMVSVRAELAGYTFSPALVYWRHYYGEEVRTIDFVGSPP